MTFPTKMADLALTIGGLKYVSMSPTSIKGGLNVTGTVVMTGNVPSNQVVNLLDDGPELTVPASATVVTGQLNKSFNITTAAVTATVQRTVTAQWGSVVTTATLTITP